jgi:hypothetical protein
VIKFQLYHGIWVFIWLAGCLTTWFAPHTLHLGWFGVGLQVLVLWGETFLSCDHHDRAWRCLDRYFFYRGVYADTVSGQQVRWSQVFQLEDPGEEDSLCMQGTDSHGSE